MTPRHLRRTLLRSGLLSAAVLVGGFFLCAKFGIGDPTACSELVRTVGRVVKETHEE